MLRAPLTSFRVACRRPGTRLVSAAVRAASVDSTRRRPFPSLTVSSSGVVANGAFAETQKAFLDPHPDDVKALDGALREANMGVVAHYYMDPELQGILQALDWAHVFTADSLAMGDAAVKMAKGGATSVVCLGVDFMAESVQATLRSQGFGHVPVFRVAEEEIGCSLASSAESASYKAWLDKASQTSRSLHVVYINTSLSTKAQAHAMLPTITCTSSNVVRTILQAFSQVPDLQVYYGPDTYMGENLRSLFQGMSELSDEAIAQIHPLHSSQSIASILDRFHVYQQGMCVVHHMFGDSVAETIRRNYGDAYHTAHLEVPGSMFHVAHASARDGRGVVGSTSNILDFIKEKSMEAVACQRDKISLVLGTEAGMITPVVKEVKAIVHGSGTAVEIVFPVSEDAFSVADAADSAVLESAIVPGSLTGAGCSASGGCATCPFMKQNSFDALMDLLDIQQHQGTRRLARFLAQGRGIQDEAYLKETLENGSIPIHHMRQFTHLGVLPPDLVNDIARRNSARTG